MKSRDIFVKYMRNKRDEERLQKVDKGKPQLSNVLSFHILLFPTLSSLLIEEVFSFFSPVFFLVSPFGKRWGNIFALHYLFPLAVKKTRSGGKGGTYGFLYFFSSLFLLFFFGESDNGSAVILYKILSERKSSRNNCSSKMILCQ